MMTKEQNDFGQLLQQLRKRKGLSRSALAERVGLDASHIYRIETGDRQPSRESALALAEALETDEEPANKLLIAAGYAPVPTLKLARAAVRLRGGGRRETAEASSSPHWDAARWALALEALGLQEVTIGELLRAMETAGLAEGREATAAVRATFSRVIESLLAPVRTAVIPAAGRQSRLLALDYMQRLILSVIGEAAECGITQIILVLAPGAVEPLYRPLNDALNISVIPSIKLHYCVQAEPQGLGDAILRAEELVGQSPFAVLLPDDLVRERAGQTVTHRELRTMMEAFKKLNSAHLVAVTHVARSKMSQYGIARAGSIESAPNIRPVSKLIEKPASTNSIFRSPNAFGVVGRYLLQPDIFRSLREQKEEGSENLELTDALDRLRKQGQKVYAFEIDAVRQDIGEVVGQASKLIGNISSEKT
jgi:UTP--glucose-1-phosphate uridylyltransferase